MTNKLFLLTILLLSLLLNSCGSNSLGEGEQAFTQQEKEFVHTLFLTEYLWSDQVASNIDYKPYSQPQELVNTLKYDLYDKWSGVTTKQVLEDRNNQKRAGYGFKFTSNFIVVYTLINSPAYNKLLRGDKILYLNGNAISETLLKETSKSKNTTIFTVLRNGNEIDISIKPSIYNYKVTLSKILKESNKTIGYLRFDSFSENSDRELEEAFTIFNTNKIDELVIDLRYNGGGYLKIVSVLLENISNSHAEQRQFYLDGNAYYNNKYKDNTYHFEDADLQDGNELDMKRVIFLITPNSASASEVVINALKPYLGDNNVITIGSNTHGKPVGMSGKQYGKNIYFVINFYTKNNNGQTTSFEGISPTCSAVDDISHSMGDTNETMLSTALYYIQNNKCP
jgi:C-terminal processing protease CtpA/Prc